MAPPVPTTIATGFADLSGCAYRLSTNQLLAVDAGAGSIVAVNVHTNAKTVLGTGYNAPSDIELSADGMHAYVTEKPGALLRVNLGAANRASAVVVASGLNGVDQIALDEAHGFAYVAEATASTIQRINLATGTKTTVTSAVSHPRGVLLSSDTRYLYVSDDADNITSFDLSTSTHSVIASGLAAPRHLTWADAGNSAILVPVNNAPTAVLRVDLAVTPAAVSAVTGTAPFAPYSVALSSPGNLLIASAQTVSKCDLTGFVASPAGPFLLGIGFVPADIAHLPGGYATTDPAYFFYVKNCPFGGTLPLMMNWEHAASVGAHYYQVSIEHSGSPPVLITQPFNDYVWNGSEFILGTTVPTSGFYPVRKVGPGAPIWLNDRLGLLLDTTGRPNDLNTIKIRLFSALSLGSEIGHATDPGRHATVMIDNTGPMATIEKILHDGSEVKVCEIVSTGSHTLTFQVTASAPRHLGGWSMTAYWGDNKSKTVAADNYSSHVAGGPIWMGLTSLVIPPAGGVPPTPPPSPVPWDANVPGDPTSIHCAHTFFLDAWDRVINGWGYVHGDASYHKSITLNF